MVELSEVRQVMVTWVKDFEHWIIEFEIVIAYYQHQFPPISTTSEQTIFSTLNIFRNLSTSFGEYLDAEQSHSTWGNLLTTIFSVVVKCNFCRVYTQSPHPNKTYVLCQNYGLSAEAYLKFRSRAQILQVSSIG